MGRTSTWLGTGLLVEIEVVGGNRHLVVRPRGLLSLRTATRLRDVLLKAAAEEPRGLVCDLTGARATPEGLTVLHVVADQVADWPASPMVVVASDPVLVQQLERLGLLRRLTVVHGHDEAEAALRRAPRLLRVTIDLPPTLDAPAAARAFVGAALTRWQVPSVLEEAHWVVSELVTNAVLHARTDLTVRVALSRHRVNLSVSDRGQGRRVEPGGGYGLTVVERLSRTWGSLPRLGGGTVVWAVLDVAPRAAVVPYQAVRR
jgi:anti-anti-sigma regulatory factor